MIRSLTLWDRNFRRLKRYFLASSMVETVVALTILLSILTISFICLDRINSSLNPNAKYKAYLATNSVLDRQDLLFAERGSYEVNGYVVEKRLSSQSNGIYRVELTVLNGLGRTVYVRKILKSSEIEL